MSENILALCSKTRIGWKRLATESAAGTSETNGLSRFESAIGVRPDVGPPAAQGRI
jgi:hypothetical protein